MLYKYFFVILNENSNNFYKLYNKNNLLMYTHISYFQVHSDNL